MIKKVSYNTFAINCEHKKFIAYRVFVSLNPKIDKRLFFINFRVYVFSSVLEFRSF